MSSIISAMLSLDSKSHVLKTPKASARKIMPHFSIRHKPTPARTKRDPSVIKNKAFSTGVASTWPVPGLTSNTTANAMNKTAHTQRPMHTNVTHPGRTFSDEDNVPTPSSSIDVVISQLTITHSLKNNAYSNYTRHSPSRNHPPVPDRRIRHLALFTSNATFVVDKRPDFCYTGTRKGMMDDARLGLTKSELSIVRPMRHLRRAVLYKGGRDGTPGTGHRSPD